MWAAIKRLFSRQPPPVQYRLPHHRMSSATAARIKGKLHTHTNEELAKEYRVTPVAVRSIRSGWSWKGIAPYVEQTLPTPITTAPKKRTYRHRTHLSPPRRAELYMDYLSGRYSTDELATLYEVAHSTTSRIIREERERMKVLSGRKVVP